MKTKLKETGALMIFDRHPKYSDKYDRHLSGYKLLRDSNFH